MLPQGLDASGKLFQDRLYLWQVAGPKKIEVDKQRIQVTDCPLLLVVQRKGEMVVVGFIKRGPEAAKKRGHSKVHRTVAVINSGIN